MIYDGLLDCVVCRIKNTDVILVALYIAPSNSVYFDEKYFTNLELIYSMFHSYQLLLLGDFNCRIGTPQNNININYIPNPDATINANGSRLKRWISGKEILILNGYNCNSKSFDSNFTFFRGTSRSQNDLVVSNAVGIVDSLSILDKQIYSDHSPISIFISVEPRCSLNYILNCAQGTLSDDRWDVNKRKIPSLVFDKVDWPKAIIALEGKSQSLTELVQDPGMTMYTE